jgi:hypothetical protein
MHNLEFLDWRYDVGVKWIIGFIYLRILVNSKTPFQKVIEMSRIKALPQQEKADFPDLN